MKQAANSNNKNESGFTRWVTQMNGTQKLVVSIVTGIMFCAIFLLGGIDNITSTMAGWDAFTLCSILLSWFIFWNTDVAALRLQAKKQDENRFTIFLIVVAAVILSLGGILFILRNSGDDKTSQLQYIFSMLGVALSWTLLHTTFTLRYTHLFYEFTKTKPDGYQGGLAFPDPDQLPGYLDFAYFSFVIGMTFQVSDVTITSPKIRKIVLLHGLISFIFNTIVVALTISAIANLQR